MIVLKRTVATDWTAKQSFFLRTQPTQAVFKQKVWSGCRNGEEGWGETKRKTPTGLILTQPFIKDIYLDATSFSQ